MSVSLGGCLVIVLCLGWTSALGANIFEFIGWDYR